MDHPSSKSTTTNRTREWISILDAMRDTLERQETRILELEEENQLLRSELDDVEVTRNHQRMGPNNRNDIDELDDIVSTPSVRLQSPPPVILSSRVQPTTATPNNISYNNRNRNRNDRTPVTPENVLVANDDIDAIDRSRHYDFEPSSRSNVTSRRNRRYNRRGDGDDYYEDGDSRMNDRRRLQLHPNRSNGGYNDSKSASRTPPRLRSNNNNNRSYYEEVEDGREYFDPNYDTIQIKDRDMFSPGTQFVEELSRVVDIQQGHYAPLSVIMDKHFARVTQIRSRNGWDR